MAPLVATCPIASTWAVANAECQARGLRLCDPDELAGLACEPGVEARLVEENGPDGPWQVSHGPFDDATFERLSEGHWSLLVQAVDHYVPSIAALMDEFDFLPRWRLDDIMVSYAPPGGSVGPHIDQYDVFLLI